MTFSYTRATELLIGARRLIYGTFTNSGEDTGGTIETTLRAIENFQITYLGSATVANAAALNATLIVSGTKKIVELTAPLGNAVIVLPTNTSGFWLAIGW